MEMIGRYLNLFFVLCVCMCDVTIKRKKGILFFFFYSTLIPEIGFECLPGTHVLNRPSKQMQSTHKTELRALDTRLSACARSIIFHVNVLFQKRKKRI